MRTQCNTTASEFAPVEGRPVVAEFDGGALTFRRRGCCWAPPTEPWIWSRRLAGCFRDRRDPRLVEHAVAHSGRAARVRHRARL